jgi:serine/threonine protein phosphatase PrpC
MALERGGEDNVTVVLAQVEGEGLPPSTEGEGTVVETV